MTSYMAPPGVPPTANKPIEERAAMKNEKTEAELAQFASRGRVLYERGAHSFIVSPAVEKPVLLAAAAVQVVKQQLRLDRQGLRAFSVAGVQRLLRLPLEVSDLADLRLLEVDNVGRQRLQSSVI